MIQRISFSLPLGSGWLSSRKMFERMPSVQSRVTGSISPYSSLSGCAFGLMTNRLHHDVLGLEPGAA